MRIRVLEERLRLMRIEKYGAGGEKLSQAQMQLFMPQRVKTVLQQGLHFILPLSVLFHAPASSIPHNSLKMSLKRGLRERKVFKLESRCPELNISRGAPCAS